MNKPEKKMASVALKEAYSYFSQDGTGEFTRADLKLSKKEWDDFFLQLEKFWNKKRCGKLSDIVEEHEGSIPFFVAFSYLIDKLK